MTEQLCPICQAANPPDNRFCGRCGSRLSSTELAAQKTVEKGDSFVTSDILPDVDVRRLGRTLAISVGAFVAQAAIQRARQRVLGESRSASDPSVKPRSAVNAGLGALVGMALVAAERHISRLDDGRSVRKILSRNTRKKDAG